MFSTNWANFFSFSRPRVLNHFEACLPPHKALTFSSPLKFSRKSSQLFPCKFVTRAKLKTMHSFGGLAYECPTGLWQESLNFCAFFVRTSFSKKRGPLPASKVRHFSLFLFSSPKLHTTFSPFSPVPSWLPRAPSRSIKMRLIIGGYTHTNFTCTFVWSEWTLVPVAATNWSFVAFAESWLRGRLWRTRLLGLSIGPFRSGNLATNLLQSSFYAFEFFLSGKKYLNKFIHLSIQSTRKCRFFLNQFFK